MNYPYRTEQKAVARTIEVETNDAFVEVAYYDRAGVFAIKKREFIGSPTAWAYSYERSEPRWSTHTGKSSYNDWKSNIGTTQFVTFDDILIPMHRVLDIRVEVKKRTAVVDVEERD
jgi:uncharacterized protein (UPF0248 family)